MHFRHQKERAIALMAGNGFLLFQVLSDPKRAAEAIAIAARVPFRISSSDDLVMALLFAALAMLAPGYGLIQAYKALARVNENGTEAEVQNAEKLLRQAFWAPVGAAVVAAIVMVVYLIAIELNWAGTPN